MLDHSEALAELAGRYFTSRGPVTLQDIVWWSGLPVMLSAAKHLAAHCARPFAEFTLSEANGLRVTRFGTYIDDYFVSPTFPHMAYLYRENVASQ